ncbi:hypothetical protein DIS24_g7611 [Lasiodiplodia hormozganensis]|uniref:Uncharacterized protein n=1 Tax=Lasiodiplodia hormozganensis TaxID=869390 RepID=A0AA39Y920_9PEZI|nr:hypothetical protein DIS24_g7611 [Lasiodiplodia hormozganensis]
MPASTPLVPFAPAFVEWHCSDQNATTYLGHRHPRPPSQLALEIRFEEAENVAFFKLRCPVALKACTKKTNVFVFVLPDRILSLDAGSDTDAAVPEPVRQGLVQAKACSSSDPICSLRFTLSKPPVVIVPAATSLAPATTASGIILNSLQSFAQTTDFTIHLPEKHICQQRLISLCTMARDGGLKTMSSQMDLTSLHKGKGAEMVEGVNLHIPSPVESPPSYDELSLSPPPPPISGKDAKTRARDSPSPGPSAKKPKLAPSPLEDLGVQQQMLENQVAKLVNKALDGFRCEMRQEMQERLQKLEEKFEKKIDDLAQELRDEVGDDMENVRCEATELADMRVEEQMLIVKDELRLHVEEEMKDVEDRIKDRVCSATLTLDFD